MKPKKLNRQLVLSAATMLILLDGHTTAPMVKHYLLDRGYRAGQSEVACWLLRIAQREGWRVKDNGVYRIYAFPVTKTVDCKPLLMNRLASLPLPLS